MTTSTPDPGRPLTLAAGVCGLAAGTVALAVGQVGARLVPGATAPLQALGDLVIRVTPITVTEAVIGAVGRNDKTLLLSLVMLVAAGLMVLVGVLYVRGRRLVAMVGVALLALVPVVAVATAPVGRITPTLVVMLPAALVGAAALRVLGAPLAAARTGGPVEPARPGREVGRRQLLRGGAVLLGAATAGDLAFRSLGGPSRAIARRLGTALPAPVPALPALVDDFSSMGASPLITPLSAFYRIDTALDPPRVDPDTWRLTVSRDGGTTLRTFTYDELLGLATTEADITIGCISNEVGGDLIGTARWQGVLLTSLLAQAGVTRAPRRITGTSVDGFVASFPGQYAYDGRAALLAVGMNGRPLPVKHGFPARVVVPGLYGYSNAVKWIADLDVSDAPGLPGFWVERGWTAAVPVNITSRIDSPAGGSRTRAGAVTVAGIAWAPVVGVGTVEVQVDDGPWRPARLSRPQGGQLWRQWVLAWQATPGTHRLRVRAADAHGEQQDTRRAPVYPAGSSGLDEVTVRVT